MKKQYFLVLAGASIVASVPLQADILDLEIGANAWYADISGDIKESTGNTISLDDRDFDAGFSSSFYFALEHPLSLIPNISLTHQQMKHEEDNNSNSAIELNNNDITLYWQLLDNIANLDLGVTVRQYGIVTGDFDAASTVGLFYAKVQIAIPVIGLSAGAAAQAGGNDDDKASEGDIFIRYESPLGLGAGLGYKLMKAEFELEESSLSVDIDTDYTFDGFYLNAFYNF